MKRIRIGRPRIRREQPWPEDLPADPRDPDVVRAKALARSQLTGSSRSNRTQWVNTMHPYVSELLARQRESELRRSARRHGPAGPRSRRPVTAAGTTHFGGKTMRSKPMILVALLLAAFLVNLDTTLVNVALPAMVRELHATPRSCSGWSTLSTSCSPRCC